VKNNRNVYEQKQGSILLGRIRGEHGEVREIYSRYGVVLEDE